MKTTTLAVAFLVLLTISATAQSDSDQQPKSNKIEIGFNVSQYQKDFGVGIHLISPYFFDSRVAIKAGANAQWLEHLNGTETTWTPYQNFQIGVRSRNIIIIDKIFIYGEGGTLFILPNSAFSAESLAIGGYGLFGFEFKPLQQFAYFIELGGIGSGATADRIPGKPIYSNGFLVNVGFRVGL